MVAKIYKKLTHLFALVIIILAFFVAIALLCSGVSKLCIYYTQDKIAIDRDMIFLLSKEDSQDWNRSLKSNRLVPDYFYVFAHSNGNPEKGARFMSDERTDKRVYYTPRAMAELIQKEMAERNIPLNTPVFLMSCNTGAGIDPFGKMVSSFLSSEVVAVDQWLLVDDLGITRTASNVWWGYVNPMGFSYKRFIKGVEVNKSQEEIKEKVIDI